jgi:DNA-binding response OmpR family regulator
MGAKIAVINDDTQFLRMMEHILTTEGYEVCTLYEAGPAPAHVREWQPDLIVLDIRIESPQSGIKVLELLKLDIATENIPIIICSADHAMMRSMEERLSQMECWILLKPFKAKELLDMVRARTSYAH